MLNKFFFGNLFDGLIVLSLFIVYLICIVKSGKNPYVIDYGIILFGLVEFIFLVRGVKTIFMGV